MSTSHDPQFGTPNQPSGNRGPAAIVWSDPAPGAAPAWAGPGAFSAPEQHVPDHAPAQSLSSAWASAAPAWNAPEAEEETEQPQEQLPQEPPAHVADDAGSAEPHVEEADDQHEPSHWNAAGAGALGGAAAAGGLGGAAAAGAASPAGWVQPGAAPTADEVHHDWTEQHGELPPSSEPWAAPEDDRVADGAQGQPSWFGADEAAQPQAEQEPAAVSEPASTYDPYAPAAHDAAPQVRADEPYAQPAQHGADQAPAYDAYAAPARHDLQHDDGMQSFLEKPSAAAEAAQDGPPASDAHGAPNWGNDAASGAHWQQNASAAEDAWSAHQQSDSDHPMATDPAAGEAIPAPPMGQETAMASHVGGDSHPDSASDDEALTIGRGRDNSIVLDDMLVSRKHLRISADDQGLLLEDLGSRNGTYVNGRRVETSHLQEGDRIGVGGTTFEVRDGWLVTI